MPADDEHKKKLRSDLAVKLITFMAPEIEIGNLSTAEVMEVLVGTAVLGTKIYSSNFDASCAELLMYFMDKAREKGANIVFEKISEQELNDRTIN